MSIADWRAKINSADLMLILTVILAGSLGFGLGRLSKLEASRSPVRIETPAIPLSAGLPAQAGATTGQVVASKNSDKYHLPSCAGAQAIKEENKIWFASPEEARQAGYMPAANCPGL